LVPLDLLRRVTEGTPWSRGLPRRLSRLELNAVPDPSGARCPETGQDAGHKACDAAGHFWKQFRNITQDDFARFTPRRIFPVSPGSGSCH
jgi:hypothetical protein